MNTNVRCLLVFILSLLCYSCGYRNPSKGNSDVSSEDSIKMNLRVYQGLLVQTEDSWLISMSYEGKTVPLQVLVYGVDGITYTLSQIRHKYNVFLRISPSHCWSCVEEVAKHVSKSHRRVAFLVEGERSEASDALLELAKITSNYYYTPVGSLVADSLLQPYFFEISSAEEYQRVFIPNKERPAMITRYLTLQNSK